MKIAGSQFARIAEASRYLIDDHVGIIRFVQEVPREAGDPDFFHYYAQACTTKAFCDQQNFSRAGGASSDRRLALAKAIGEAVERYCSACYHAQDLPLSSYSKAPFQCVPPEEFALYSSGQCSQKGFPYSTFSPETVVRWASAKELKTGNVWRLPASMVYLPYYYQNENGENPIVQPISTGLACHSSFEEAAKSAICEVIERDAFTIAWQARLPVPTIKTESLTGSNRNLIDRFERSGNSVRLFNITTDVNIPSILAVSRNSHPEAPALVFAASTDLDPQQAARKSLEELAHTWQLARDLKDHLPPIIAKPDFLNVVHQDDHILLYADHRNSHLTDFLWTAEEHMDCSDIENLSSGYPTIDLEILLEKVWSINHRVLIADLTTDDVGALGLTVVRAIIPGFHPLFMGHRFRALGGTRLWTVPQKLGYEAITALGENPAPHPYP